MSHIDFFGIKLMCLQFCINLPNRYNKTNFSFIIFSVLILHTSLSYFLSCKLWTSSILKQVACIKVILNSVCCKTVVWAIMSNQVKKKIKCQLVRFYFRILSRFLSRTIKTKNEIEYENKFWKVEFDSYLHKKASLYCRHQISLFVHHSSHQKCFQIMVLNL